MNYQSYYENDPGQQDGGEQNQRPKVGRIVLLVVLIAAVLAIVAILVAGVVRSIQQNIPWAELLPQYTPAPTPMAEQTVQPEPTPFPTQRPMADLDGTAPFIIESDNPIPDIAEAVGECVVGVENYVQMSLGIGNEDVLQGQGSGFVISSEGYILTNCHVVQGADSLKVTLQNGDEVDAELIGKDAFMDIAVLKVAHQGLKALKFGDSDSIRVGEYVVAVGNPLGRELEGTVTMGIISARARSINIDGQTNTYIQTDAAINFGNSGGPLLNMSGEVIGINTAKSITAGYDEYGRSISAEGLGFALPINDVKGIVEELITKGYIQRPAIGITVVTLTNAEAEELGIPAGVMVYGVVRGGPAEQSGLQAGDVVIRCEGVAIETQTQLTDMIEEKSVGDQLDFTILRDNEEQTIRVTLGDKNSMDFTNQVEVEQ